MRGGCASVGVLQGSPESESIDLTAQALAAAKVSGFNAVCRRRRTSHLHMVRLHRADVLTSFEKALGVTVIVDTFDSNEAMYAKLKAGGTGYDIITPSSYQIGTMAKEGMIVALDQNKIPTVKQNFDKAFTAQVLDPTFKFSVPYAVNLHGSSRTLRTRFLGGRRQQLAILAIRR